MIITNNPFDLSREFDKIWTSAIKSGSAAPAYPPHNVVKVSDDKHVLELAIAGFKRGEIEVISEGNLLKITGKHEDDGKEYLHKGIGTRKFVRVFPLPEYFQVESAGMDNGILYVDIVRYIPEEKKPKQITIN